MSQNPYAHPQYPSDFNQSPPRTSVMAICSLVSSLLCCLAPVGILLGIIAMFRIKSSNGRRTGMGLAIAGIIIGVIVSIILTFVLIGAYTGMQAMGKMFNPPVVMMTNTNVAQVRPQLSAALSGQFTDADWAAFQSAVVTELGTIQPPPNNMISFFKQYGEVGQMLQGQNRQNEVPIPLIGTSGKGILFIHMPGRGTVNNPKGTPGDILLSMAVNFSVLLPSGKEVYLVDPDKVKSTAPFKINVPMPGEKKDKDGV